MKLNIAFKLTGIVILSISAIISGYIINVSNDAAFHHDFYMLGLGAFITIGVWLCHVDIPE